MTLKNMLRATNGPWSKFGWIFQRFAWCLLFVLNSQMARAQATNITAIEKEVEQLIQERYENNGRYVTGPAKRGSPTPFCKEVAAGSELSTNEFITPYLNGIKNKSATVLECNYSFLKDDKRRGWVIALASDAPLMAKRVVGACAAVARKSLRDCALMMLKTSYKYPWGSNGFIYPVTGFVREPCKKGGEGLIGFRHGVTIQYADKDNLTPRLTYCDKELRSVAWQRSVGLSLPTSEVFNIGRLAAVSRAEIEEIEKDIQPQLMEKLAGGSDGFQSYVRANEICAVNTGYDRMMTIKAALLLKVKVPNRKECGK